MKATEEDVKEARAHLMKSANLYNLCVQAVDKAIAPYVPPIAQTSEQFQAAVASLYIEASRSGFVSKMPTKPLGVSQGNGATTAEASTQKEAYQPEPF